MAVTVKNRSCMVTIALTNVLCILIIALWMCYDSGAPSTTLIHEAFEERASIPKIIYFTYSHKLDSSVQNYKWSLIVQNMARIRQLNPEFEVKYFDDEQCAEYIRTHLGTEMEEYFNMEWQGMYKADIFRVIVLFFEGGYYLDVDLDLKMPLPSFIRNDTKFSTVVDHLGTNIFQAFIAVVPKHPIMAQNIELMLQFYRGQLNISGWMGTAIMRRSILQHYGYDVNEKNNLPKRFWNIAQKPGIQLFKECDVQDADCPAMHQDLVFDLHTSLGTVFVVWDWVAANNDSRSRDAIIPFYSRAIDYSIMHS